MCGRYFQQRGPAELARYFETINALPNLPASWNRAPTQEALVVRRHPETGQRHLDPLRWGLVPRWAKDASGAAKMINARSESIAEKPAFREAFRKRRCLVTADGFYEWQTDGKAKQPYAVALADGAPMALAGLWEGWRSPEGEILRSCTIVTTEANEKLAALHHRMPVILPRAAWAAWLGEAPAEAEDLLALLRPCPPAMVAAWPVSPRVNKVAENEAGLLARDPLAMPPPGLDDPPPNFGD
ncbi:SOS response-associated peptidase [Roseicella frigidaeris]|uniref:Abasic site processing protein n=1 Tax=Roseicella frigidaeris TaxID=2230885 RepID=A0A327M7X2_9PROT|nr:SOS response-associated peptidase [Roseicella frigidaeris]RAI56168.1 SOS response-associated peptidase [Roseicella frigidaeris]